MINTPFKEADKTATTPREFPGVTLFSLGNSRESETPTTLKGKQ
jgi:hypothetical protein